MDQRKQELIKRERERERERERREGYIDAFETDTLQGTIFNLKKIPTKKVIIYIS